MIYFKSVMAGILAAIIGAVLWLLVAFVLPLFVPFLVSRVLRSDGGVGAAGAVVDSGSVLTAALVCFGIGFYWAFRRGRRRRR